MKRPIGYWLLFIASLSCGKDEEPPKEGCKQVEALSSEPAGAPAQSADGRLTCLCNNKPLPPEGNAVELTGYVRTLADPAATGAVPPAKVEAFSPEGAVLGSAFADQGKKGRVAVSVPIRTEGFSGYAVVTSTAADYIDWRLEATRPVTRTEANGWAWLTTRVEADQRATTLGVTLDANKGILVGSVHDCDGFGVQYAVVQVAGSTDGIYYVEGFDLTDSRTFTSEAGRFVVPNVSAGTVEIKVFGRLEQSGPLTLLSSKLAGVEAGRMTAVSLQPFVE